MSLDGIKNKNRGNGISIYHIGEKIKKNYSNKKLALFAIVALLVQLLSPFKIKAAIATTDPVQSLSPDVDTHDVQTGITHSVITFTKTPLASTVNSVNIQVRKYLNDASITSSVTVSGNTVTINHSALVDNTAYYYYIATGLTFTDNSNFPSGWGSTHPQKYNHAFTTAADHLLSEGTTTTPASKSGSISTAANSVSVTFNRTVIASTVNTTNMSLKKYSDNSVISTAVALDSTGKTAKFTHPALAANTAYFVYVRSTVGGTYTTGIQYTDGMDFATGWGVMTSEKYNHAITTDTSGFTGTSTTADPAIGAVGVQSGITSSTITFNKVIDTSTLNGNVAIKKYSDGSTVGTQTVTIDPNNPKKVNITHGALADSTQYFYYVRTMVGSDYTSGLKFTDGLDFGPGWGYSTSEKSAHAFTTAQPDTTAPTATSIPADGTTGVAINVLPTITFSEAVNGATSANIGLKKYSDDSDVALDSQAGVTYLATNKSVTIKPAANLDQSTQYYFVISNGVTDIAGNHFVAWDQSTKASHEFTTGTSADNTAPTVSTTPALGASNVQITVHPTLVFSKDMDATTMTSDNIKLKLVSDDSEVVSTISYNDSTKTATIVPNNNLTANSDFYYSINNTVQDNFGNKFSAWDSTNKASHAFSTDIDNVIPVVDSTDPADGDDNIGINVSPSIAFSKAMDGSTVNNTNVKLKKYSDDSSVTSTVTYSPSSHIATITPASDLATGTQYYYFISSAVKDISGNGIAMWDNTNKSDHDFTTGIGATTTVTLDVQVGETDSGTGTVTSNPSGINLISGNYDSSYDFSANQNITLTATADSGSKFDSWENCSPVQGTPTQCTVSVSAVDGYKTVYAHFVSTKTHDITQINAPVTKGAVQITMTNSMPSGVTAMDFIVANPHTTGNPLPEDRNLFDIFNITAADQGGNAVENLSPGIAHIVLTPEKLSHTSVVKYWDGSQWSDQGITNVQVSSDIKTISFDSDHFSEYAVFSGTQDEGGFLPEAGANSLNFFVNLMLSALIYLLLSSLIKRSALRKILV